MMSERPLFSNADAVPAGKLNFARLFSSIVLAVILPALLLPFVSLSLEGDAVQSISGYDVLFRDASWFESVHIETKDQVLMVAVIASVLLGTALSVLKKQPGAVIAFTFIAIICTMVLGHGLVAADVGDDYSMSYGCGFYFLFSFLTVSVGANIHSLKKWGTWHFSTQIMAEAGMMLALTTLLGLIKVYTMPMGGSVTAASMLPIVLLAMVRGPVAGIIAGALYGMLDMLLGGYVIDPVQALLDYPLAFAALGLAGLFWRPGLRRKAGSIVKLLPVIGVFVAISLRFLCHFLAGIWFFGHFAPQGQAVWVYSLSYNALYLIPEFIITGLLAWMLAPALTKYISTRSGLR